MGVAVETAEEGRRARKRHQRSVLLAAQESTRSDRRYRQRIQRVDLWSVLKVSLCFYMAALAVTLVAGVVLWLIADNVGLIKDFESFMGHLLSSKNYKLVSAKLIAGSALVGMVLVALMTISTVIAAAFYNLFAELIGGVEVVVVEDEVDQRR